MLKKLLDLVNVKKWFEGVLISKLMAKAARGATSALVGVITAPWFVTKAQPILTQLGIVVDPDKVEAGAIVVVSGLLMSVLNWAKVKLKLPV